MVKHINLSEWILLSLSSKKTGLFVSDTIHPLPPQKIQRNKAPFISSWSDNGSSWNYSLDGSMISAEGPHYQRSDAGSHFKSLVSPQIIVNTNYTFRTNIPPIVCTKLGWNGGAQDFYIVKWSLWSKIGKGRLASCSSRWHYILSPIYPPTWRSKVY